MKYRISGYITEKTQTIDLGIKDQLGRQVGLHVFTSKRHVETLSHEHSSTSSDVVDMGGIYYFARVQNIRNGVDFGVISKYKIFKTYKEMFEYLNNTVEHYRTVLSEKFVE